MGYRLRSDIGQTTVEWIGLIGLVAALVIAMAYLGMGAPVAGLAHSVSTRILCAASLSGACGATGSLEGAYGRDLAELVRRRAPTLMYGRDMLGLPVDFRTCRSPNCADGTGQGEQVESTAGEPVTLFTRVIEDDGATFVQYWAYYPESASLRGAPLLERKGYHPHDWESVQIRVATDGTVSQRASSHAGYNHARSALNWGSDLGWGLLSDAAEATGLREKGGWGAATGEYLIAGGSHAGNVKGDSSENQYPSYTPAGKVRLVPLETTRGGPLSRPARFDPITPPWGKRVWDDPEAEGTG